MNNGNITEKKTKQQLADFIGINVKTMRNSCRYAENIKIIEENIGVERAKKFDDIVRSLEKIKKRK